MNQVDTINQYIKHAIRWEIEHEGLSVPMLCIYVTMDYQYERIISNDFLYCIRCDDENMLVANVILTEEMISKLDIYV